MIYTNQLLLLRELQRSRPGIHSDARYIYKHLINKALDYGNESICTNTERITACTGVQDPLTHLEALKQIGAFLKLDICENVIKITFKVI